MHLIAHRGNLDGPRPELENSPDYIEAALAAGFEVEIDVWCQDGAFSLGHDEPSYPIDLSYLARPGLWCHAKDLNALEQMLRWPSIHCFWHEDDTATLTSRGFIWTYPGKPLTRQSISVLPGGEDRDWRVAAGVCSDWISKIRDIVNDRRPR